MRRRSERRRRRREREGEEESHRFAECDYCSLDPERSRAAPLHSSVYHVGKASVDGTSPLPPWCPPCLPETRISPVFLPLPRSLRLTSLSRSSSAHIVLLEMGPMLLLYKIVDSHTSAIIFPSGVLTRPEIYRRGSARSCRDRSAKDTHLLPRSPPSAITVSQRARETSE
jgi:hypothetical protein